MGAYSAYEAVGRFERRRSVTRGHKTPRLRAGWPLLVVILGGGLAVSSLKSLDGLVLSFRPVELLQILANTALLDLAAGIAAVLACFLLASLLAALARRDRDELFPTLALAAARFLLAAYFGYALLLWLQAIAWVPHVPSDRYWLLIAAPSALMSLFATWRYPAPGPILRGVQPLAAIGLGLALIGGGGLLVRSLSASSSPASSAERSAARPVPRHVVVLSIDTLSAEHLSAHGYPIATSPNLDRLAARGLRYDRFYANANWTTPGMASLATGNRPWTTRSGVQASRPRPASVQGNLFRVAAADGFRTAAFITNPNGTPLQLGIAGDAAVVGCDLSNRVEWLIAGCAGSFLSIDAAAFNMSLLSRVLNRVPDAWLAKWRTGDVRAIAEPRVALEAAARWLEATRERSALVWVHLLPPHDPYVVPAPFLGSIDAREDFRSHAELTAIPGFNARDSQAQLDRQRPRYDEAIRYVDARVGEFLDRLAADPVLREALIVVTADHGESFRHGYGSHGGLRLPEEVIRVPLIIAGPGITPGVDIQLREQVDLVPTLAALLGSEPPAGMVWEGQPLMKGRLGTDVQPVPGADEIYSMSLEQTSSRGPLTRGAIALVRGPYKYVHYFGKPSYPNMPVLRDELYDVLADPTEEHDLIGTRPDIEQPMLQAIRAQIDAHR